ncbi:MAG: ATP-binding cassette domain-containing protein [Treponema sp.]|jgi:ABC-type multidrug transport system ATPase subunit|nr:ATP-binding cassette domain-containing protein [Treponema sp.]
MEKIIELKEISFSDHDGSKIIQDISIDFQPGKTTAIVGPSGGGKSTVLKISAGLLLPNHGEVLYNGKNVALMSRSETLEFRRAGAFVFQDSALWANMDLFNILELPLKIHFPNMAKKQRQERIKDVATQAGYRKALNVRPSSLSMGEQKLIAFARAMLCDPSVLFLDEWTESLDENAADRLINIVRKKQRESATILFVSHDMRIIKDLADFVVVVEDGRVTKNAPKDQITSDLLLNDFIKTGIVS